MVFDQLELADNQSPSKIQLLRYDVRTTETLVVNTVELPPGSYEALHIPATPYLLLSSHDGLQTITESLNVYTLETTQLPAGKTSQIYHYESKTETISYLSENQDAISIIVHSLDGEKTLVKKLHDGTKIANLRLSPDGEKLFYTSYRRGWPYIFIRQINGTVWNLKTGETSIVYHPGLILGILSAIGDLKYAEHSSIQWEESSQAILAHQSKLSFPTINTRLHRIPIE